MNSRSERYSHELLPPDLCLLQGVQRWREKPDNVLTSVPPFPPPPHLPPTPLTHGQLSVQTASWFVQPPCARSQRSVQTRTLFLHPSCAIAYIKICAHVENPKYWQPYHCLDIIMTMLHTLVLVGTGSAVRRPGFPRKGRTNEVFGRI